MKPNCRKITQVINYIATKQGGVNVDELKIVKLIWAADRYHLRKYARTVTGDNYVAMWRGPVGSSVKDIIEFETNYGNITDDDLKYIEKFNKFNQTNKDGFVSVVQSTDVDELSETDIEALDFALEQFGAMQTEDLIELTHQYPEWKKHEKELLERKVLAIDLKDFFSNPSQMQNDPFASTDEILNLSKEIYLEYV